MQDFIAIATIFIALSFAAIVMIDFISGLVAIWEKAGSQSQPQVELEPAIEPQVIAPKVEASALPDLWVLPLEEIAIALPPQQINNIKPIFLLPAALEVVKQPENVIDYSGWSIRELKKEAQRRKLGKYSSLTKSQLIERLAA